MDKINMTDTNQVVEASVTYQLALDDNDSRVCLSTVKVDYVQELGFGVVIDYVNNFSRVVPLVFVSIDDAKEFRDTYYNKIRDRRRGFINNSYKLQVIEIKGKRSLYKIHSNIDVFVSLANYKYMQPKLVKLNAQSQEAIKERDNLLSYYSWLQGIKAELIKYGWAIRKAQFSYVENKSTYFIEFTDTKFNVSIHLFNNQGKTRVEILSPHRLYDWTNFFRGVDEKACIYNDRFMSIFTKKEASSIKTAKKIYDILKKYYPTKTSYDSQECTISLGPSNLKFDFHWSSINEEEWDWDMLTRLCITERGIYSQVLNIDIWIYALLTCYCYMNYTKPLVFDFQKDGYKPIIDFLNYVTTINYENVINDMINKNLIKLVETSKEMLEHKN